MTSASNYFYNHMHSDLALATITTIFLATARLYFKALFDVATIQGWLDFEGGIYRDWHICAYAHMYIIADPVPCSEILRVAFIGMSWLKYVATFWGRQDSRCSKIEEIRYIISSINLDYAQALLKISSYAHSTPIYSIH